MQNPFRKYKTTVDWIDKDTMSLESEVTVINLFNIEEWAECNNSSYDFKDNLKRTCITMKNGNIYKARVTFDAFDALMDDFLIEAKILDDRSMRDKKKEVDLPAKITYKGPMTYHFMEFQNGIVCNSYPSTMARPKTFEDAIMNVLYSAVIPFN